MLPRAEPRIIDLFPPGVVVGAAPVGGSPDDRGGVSRTAAHASDARRAEFEAGRALAERLLRALGRVPVSIGVGRRGAPAWPAGIVGSIAHARGMCVAAVAEASGFAAVGVDIEPDEPIEADLHPAILSVSEMGEPDAPNARLVFSAKESVFKAQFPVTGAELEFDQVTIRWGQRPGRFAAMVSGGPAAAGELVGRISGAFRVADGWIVTGAWVERTSATAHGGGR